MFFVLHFVFWMNCDLRESILLSIFFFCFFLFHILTVKTVLQISFNCFGLYTCYNCLRIYLFPYTIYVIADMKSMFDLKFTQEMGSPYRRMSRRLQQSELLNSPPRDDRNVQPEPSNKLSLKGKRKIQPEELDDDSSLLHNIREIKRKLNKD